VRRVGRPSPTWRSFLRNQAAGIAAIDMFVVISASFRLLYVMLILAHDSIVRFDVSEHPTATWLSRQVTEAFPWDTAPRYLLRDRDVSYGANFRRRVEAMDIVEVITAPRSPWQNAYVEPAYRFDTPRVYGTPGRLQRAPLAPRPVVLCRLLPPVTDGIFHWTRIVRSRGRFRRPRSGNRRYPPSRWSAPSLPPPRGVLLCTHR